LSNYVTGTEISDGPPLSKKKSDPPWAARTRRAFQSPNKQNPTSVHQQASEQKSLMKVISCSLL